MNTLQTFTTGSFIITENCNLGCTYCYQKDKKSIHMNTQIAEKGIDFLVQGAKNSNGKEVMAILLGGEPTLNIPLLNHILEYGYAVCSAEGLRFKMQLITNSIIYNEELEAFLQNWFDKCGGDMSIQLSIDGSPETQNTSRVFLNGAPSSHIIEEVSAKYLDFCKRNNITERIISSHNVITKDTLKNFSKDMRYVRDTLGLKSHWFLFLHEDDWTSEDADIFEVQFRDLCDEMYEAAEKGDLSLYNDSVGFAKCSYTPQRGTCAAGYEFCTFMTNGDIYPCHKFGFESPETVLGNLDDQENLDFKRIEFYRDITRKDVIGRLECIECSNANCKTCIATNLNFNGSELIAFPKYCLMVDAYDKVLRELDKKIKPFLPKKECNCGDGQCGSRDINNIDERITEIIMNILKPVIDSISELIGAQQTTIERNYEHSNNGIAIALQACKETIERLEKLEGGK